MSMLSLPIFSVLPSVLIGLFFLGVLHVKLSYSLIPLLLAALGIAYGVLAVKQKSVSITRQERWLIGAFVGYFLLFVASLWWHEGRGRELDLPSRLLFLLPLLALLARAPLQLVRIIQAIVISTLIAGGIGLLQFFVFKLPTLFPVHMYIQSGGIMASLSVFSLTASFYFQQRKHRFWQILGLFAALVGFSVCVLNQARGPWLAIPLMLWVLSLSYRRFFRPTFWIMVCVIPLAGVLLGGDLIEKRLTQAKVEVENYLIDQNGNSSVGARMDMWKSAMIGIQEKPLFGWGLEGVKEMRQQHHQQGIIGEFAAQFSHAHNQYLHDTSARGLLGLIGLLAIFFVPLRLFCLGNRRYARDSQAYFWSIIGVLHVSSIMIYCLTQAFLSHHSGIMFYAFCTLLFYGLQERAACEEGLKGLKKSPDCRPLVQGKA